MFFMIVLSAAYPGSEAHIFRACGAIADCSFCSIRTVEADVAQKTSLAEESFDMAPFTLVFNISSLCLILYLDPIVPVVFPRVFSFFFYAFYHKFESKCRMNFLVSSGEDTSLN